MDLPSLRGSRSQLFHKPVGCFSSAFKTGSTNMGGLEPLVKSTPVSGFSIRLISSESFGFSASKTATCSRDAGTGQSKIIKDPLETFMAPSTVGKSRGVEVRGCGTGTGVLPKFWLYLNVQKLEQHELVQVCLVADFLELPTCRSRVQMDHQKHICRVKLHPSV